MFLSSCFISSGKNDILEYLTNLLIKDFNVDVFLNILVWFSYSFSYYHSFIFQKDFFLKNKHVYYSEICLKPFVITMFYNKVKMMSTNNQT